MANRTYNVVKLNKTKLTELCSDHEIYSWAELARRAGMCTTTISWAFTRADGIVKVESAARIANALGVRISAIGSTVTKTVPVSNPAGADFIKAEKKEGEEEKLPKQEGNPTLQNQLILRELKLQTELLKKLVEQWS